jgi:hypothetical protein
MRRNIFACALVTGALVAALVPLSASAQTAPPAMNQSTLLALLPASMSVPLTSAIAQIQNATASGSQNDIANAQSIYQQTFGVALSDAETNLENDEGQQNDGPPPPNIASQTSADQSIVNDLIALNQLVVSASAPSTAQ